MEASSVLGWENAAKGDDEVQHKERLSVLVGLTAAKIADRGGIHRRRAGRGMIGLRTGLGQEVS